MSSDILTLTPAAISQLEKIMQKNSDKIFRISVLDKGCSGKKYDLKIDNKSKETDIKIPAGTANVYIDKKSAAFIGGTILDCKTNQKLGSWEWIFTNPHAINHCGCGESFSVED